MSRRLVVEWVGTPEENRRALAEMFAEVREEIEHQARLERERRRREDDAE